MTITASSRNWKATASGCRGRTAGESATGSGRASTADRAVSRRQRGAHNRPMTPMTTNGVCHGAPARRNPSTTSGVSTAPSEAPLWRMLLPSGRSSADRMFRAAIRRRASGPDSKKPRSVRQANSQRNSPEPGSPGSPSPSATAGQTASGVGARRRPADQDDRVQPPRPDPVGDEPEEDAAEGERIAEPLFEPPVAAVVEADRVLELSGGDGQRQPVHVVQHGGEQEHPADPPLP